MSKISANDPDGAKGATETDEHNHDGNAGLEEQLGHRDQNPLIKDADSDFPEPGGNPEHSGSRQPELTKRVKKNKSKVA
ncbi:MAG TPA: hypothetical protein VGG14_08210 [Candidatus Sulfotelmatobacter sp.]|jgi:hypothetical protein